MKKTLFAILALVGMTQVSYADALYTKGDFETSGGTINLLDAAHTFDSDTFAISFNLDKNLTELDSHIEFLNLTLGASSSYKVVIASMGNAMTMSAGNSSTFTLTVPSTSGPFVLQIESNGSATLSYDNNGTLEEIMGVNAPPYAIPDVINTATLTFDNVEASNVTTWIGEVNAEDLANPTPAPAPTPSVPEPATATLSLLALAGLAARRRRK